MDRLVDVIEQYFIENQEDTADVDLQDTNNQIKVSFKNKDKSCP